MGFIFPDFDPFPAFVILMVVVTHCEATLHV